jgi:tetratricopeptide (TPR) repeat protein
MTHRWLCVMPSLLLVTQCAARAPKLTPTQLADAGRAESLMRDGCYTCLQEAAGIYMRLLQSPTNKTPERVLRGTFETTILLAVREKELGLPAEASLARARELSSRLSGVSAGAATGATPHATPSVAAAVLLEAAEAITGDTTALDAEERQQKDDGTLARQRRATPATIEALASTSDPAANYLAIALHCEQPRGSTPTSTAAANLLTSIAKDDSSSPALLRYRAASCSGGSQSAAQTLTKMREADQRWADVYFFEGKYEMGSPARSADPERAAALLTHAIAAFPDSIAIRLMLANAHDLSGNAQAALDAFDRVLAVKPTHVDARLGRLQSLSYLSRTDDAIAAATVIIDAGAWNVGDAYYWRAWNRYQARQLDEAWSDVRQAMSLLSNTAVYALAGSIAYGRKDLETAVAHFNRAFEIDPSNCLAVWSAGLVHNDRSAWPAAAGSFAKAAACFATAAATARKELANIEKGTLAPATKARRLASTRKRLESAEDLRAQATLNVARSFMRVWMPAVWQLNGALPGPAIMRQD